MSRENVELVHTAIDAFNRQDMAVLADFCADDFEFVSVLSAVDAAGSTYRGEDAWSGYFARMHETWEQWWVDDFQVFDAGDDSAVAVVRVAGRGRQSGVTVDRTLGMTYRFREGKLSHMRAYLDPADALGAVGLTNEAMSQEHVEIVRRVYAEGLIDGAVESIRPLLAADVEYVNPPDAIEPGTRRGIDDVVGAFGAVGAFDTATSELRELFPAGDSVVAAITFRARSRGSDVELTQEEAHTWTFRNGKVTRFEWSRNLAAALEAVGLTE